MMNKLFFLLLLMPVLLITGCGDQNNKAPIGVHPDGWFIDHRATADINACGSCHGVDLKGSGAAPSCFSESIDGRSCHANGPGQAPHPVDGSYLNAANHGPDAKADLTACQTCHSDNPAGGPDSNPRFNVGINSQGGNGCESCHPTNAAHPKLWAGPDASAFHYSAGNVQAACTLCHGTALDGVGGAVGAVSCLDCHAETTNLTLDCTACHAYPPDGTADMATATGVNHRSVAAISSHGECSVCHGVKQSTNGGELSTSGAYINADHWNGQINMNSDTQYNQTNFGCDAAGCHGNDASHQLSDSGLPVALGAFGAGGAGGAPLSHDANWLLRSGHVAAAADSCLGCHVADGSGIGPSCLSCHTAGDPLTTASCASCHNSPPSLASTAIADRPNRAGAHAVHTPLTADTMACSACHSGAGSDTLNHYDTTEPASMQFLAAYNASAVASFSGNSCSNVSCHGGVTTPAWATETINVYGGGTAACQQCHKASGETNSYASGKHDKHVRSEGIACATCHSLTVLENGSGGASHFSGLQTATFELNPSLTLNSSLNYTGTSCNPACHGSENWR